MSFSFRTFHLFQLLESFDPVRGPFDGWMQNYFRAHKAVGSKDRAWISDSAYALMRHRLYLATCAKSWEWKALFACWEEREQLPVLPEHQIAYSLPKEIFCRLSAQLPEKKLHAVCGAMLERAPTMIRVNTLKIDRDTLFARLSENYRVVLCKRAPQGILFEEKCNFFAMEEFREGLFEIQDEGSQLIAELVEAQPGELVLDFCAGAGGKSLAIAPRMAGKGQLFLHDLRLSALEKAKVRIRRAGIQNVQYATPSQKHANLWRQKMDWVLVDVPCTGSGTYRRNPDAKWRFDETQFTNLLEEQRMIFAQAMSYVKPGGKIVYATCSLFAEENQQQAAFFEKQFGVRMVGNCFQSWPEEKGMDGFYGVVFTV